MLKLYDLSGKNDLRFSPPCWNVKLCLIQNKIKFKTIPVRFTDKDKITFSKSWWRPSPNKKWQFMALVNKNLKVDLMKITVKFSQINFNFYVLIQESELR